jgi:hypothetical protein
MLFNNTKFTRLSVLVVLGCSLVATTTVGATKIPESVKKAAEAQVVATSTELCVDLYALKSECVEWAWWGEWYVVRSFEVSYVVSFRFHSIRSTNEFGLFHFCSFV